MTTIQTAIRAAFTASAPLTAAFPGGLWLGEAPEGTAMPYVVQTTVAAPLTSGYGGRRYADGVVIDFAAYGDDHDAVGAAMDTLTGVFDDALLPLATGTMFDTRRTAGPADQLMPPDGNGQDVWQWRASYRFAVQAA